MSMGKFVGDSRLRDVVHELGGLSCNVLMFSVNLCKIVTRRLCQLEITCFRQRIQLYRGLYCIA